MRSALLRSGDIKNYTALGQDGIPVYAVAPQLRDTIKYRVKSEIDKQLGKKFANYLAIPQRNDQGSQIDWYVPFESERADGNYMIIPWTSATDEERAVAFAELHQFEQAMLQFGLNLQKAENLQGDLLLFSRLLCGNDNPQDLHDPENLKALRFPNPEYVYLVNNRPVITFWGFVEKNAQIYGQPFLSLKPPIPSTTPPVAPTIAPEVLAEPVKKHKCRPWLFGLLPLLLGLGFLLFFLRGCWSPQVSLSVPTLELSKGAELPEISKARQVCLAQKLYYFANNTWFNSADNLAVTDNQLIERLNQQTEANLTQCEAVLTGRPNVVGTTNSQLVNETTQPVNSGSNEPNSPANEGNKTPLAEENAGTEPPTLPEANPEPNKEEPAQEPVQQNTAKDEPLTPANPEIPTLDEQNKATTPVVPDNNQTQANNPNQQLQLSPESLKNGDLGFLNGKWNAGAGIQDKNTGKPLRLQYEFEKGKGKVHVQRGDGVLCSGEVNANLQSGKLNIGNAGISTCSDGSTYQLPEVICKPKADGTANCEGEYGKGQRFPITMKSN